MKNNIFKLSIFITVLLIIVIGLDLLSAQNTDFSEFFGVLTNSSEFSRYHGNSGTTEIIPVIEKVQTKDSCTKLIIGDSVCFQLFNDLQTCNNTYCIAGSNRAITLTGQYILAHEFLQNHPDATDIYLVIIPDTFDAYFDTTFGYNYAVMPFVETNTFSLLDEDTIESAAKIYGKPFLQKKIVNLIDYSCVNRKLYFNYINQHGNIPDDEIELASCQAIQYLNKMDQLCQNYHVNFHLLPGPIADNTNRREQLNRQIHYFYKHNMENITSQYFKNITYYPESQFRDGTHLGGDFASREALNRKINDLQKKSQELIDLSLEETQ